MIIYAKTSVSGPGIPVVGFYWVADSMASLLPAAGASDGLSYAVANWPGVAAAIPPTYSHFSVFTEDGLRVWLASLKAGSVTFAVVEVAAREAIMRDLFFVHVFFGVGPWHDLDLLSAVRDSAYEYLKARYKSVSSICTFEMMADTWVHARVAGTLFAFEVVRGDIKKTIIEVHDEFSPGFLGAAKALGHAEPVHVRNLVKTWLDNYVLEEVTGRVERFIADREIERITELARSKGSVLRRAALRVLES